MRAPSFAVLAAALAVAVAGCSFDASYKERFFAGENVLDPMPRVNTALVVPTDFEWDQTTVEFLVAFAPGATELSETERMRLYSFVDQARVRANDGLSATAGGPLGVERAAAVTSALSLRGVRVTPVIDPAAPGDVVAVSLARVSYAPQACLTDPEPAEDSRFGLPLGCASAINLGRMAANPDDLVQGQPNGEVDTEFMILGLEHYRAQQTPALIIESVGGGN